MRKLLNYDDDDAYQNFHIELFRTIIYTETRTRIELSQRTRFFLKYKFVHLKYFVQLAAELHTAGDG